MSIVQLEKNCITLNEQLDIILNIYSHIEKIENDEPEKNYGFLSYLKKSVEKNTDLNYFLVGRMNNELNCGENKNIVLSNSISERGFSLYAYIVSKKRNQLSDVNVKYLNIIKNE